MTDRLQQTLELDAPVTHVAGVSSARAKALASLGVRSVRDLVTHYPHRYLDMSQMATIQSARIGQNATIVATVYEVVLKRPKPVLDIVEVTLVDGTGTLIVTFFRQPWLAKTLAPGTQVSVAGEVEFNYGFKRMKTPFLDRLEGEDAAQVAGKVIPVHAACEALSAGLVRSCVHAALELVSNPYDPLPLDTRAKYRLMARGAAWRAIHFPHSMAQRAAARRRLAYEEPAAA